MKLRATLCLLCVTLCNVLVISNLHAQSKAKIQNIDFNPSADGNNIEITYDIVNSASGETFTITTGIFTESGKKVNAKTFTGDIGSNINGGTGKMIIWNVTKDNIVLDEGIYIEIYAKSHIPETAGIKTPEILPVPEHTGKQTSSVKTGKAVLLSTLYPGLGNSKISGKKGNLVIGVLAYGSLASALYYNYKSNRNYNHYLTTSTIAERENYYNTATNSKSIAGALAITAGVVWITDIIITATQGKNVKKNQTTAANSKLSVTFLCDYRMKTPVVGISYNF